MADQDEHGADVVAAQHVFDAGARGDAEAVGRLGEHGGVGVAEQRHLAQRVVREDGQVLLGDVARTHHRDAQAAHRAAPAGAGASATGWPVAMES